MNKDITQSEFEQKINSLNDPLYIEIQDENLKNQIETTENSFGTIRVHPNPTKGFTSVILIDNGLIKNGGVFTLYDATGNKIKFDTFSSDTFNLDISNLEKGVYLIKVQIENRIYQSKIIKI